MSKPVPPSSPNPSKTSLLQKAWDWFLSSFPFTKQGKQVRVGGATMRGGEEDSWRFYVIWGVMAATFLVLVGRAFYLQVANRDFYVAKGDEFITSKRTLAVRRGQITDTFGIPLAANAPLVTLVFSPYDYAKSYYDAQKKLQNAKTENARTNAQARLARLDLSRLAKTTGYPLEQLQEAVAIKSVDLENEKAVEAALPRGKGSRRLVLLAKVTPEQAQPTQALKFTGVSEEIFYKRFYPQAEPHAQIIGYMANNEDEKYQGRSGIELKYESTLAGKNGRMLVLKNADQSAIKELKVLEPEIAGQDVVLTIDSRLQYMLYKELERAGREQEALWASAIIIEIGTGDVLAMGAWPSFNSNDLHKRTGMAERNRVLLDSFEPGSVMKPFTVATALESGKYNTSTLINTSPGSIKVGKHTIKDGGNYGTITLAQLIQKSSNVASTKIALNLPSDSITKMQRAFGFGQRTAIEFPSEGSGVVKEPAAGDIARRATVSYGYGQAITLAQLGQAYAALGAGGVLHPLRLVKNKPAATPVQVISKKNADDIVAMMELVTLQGGTGKQAAIDGYRVAGKTGTSRRASPKGGYIQGEYRALFAGVAPASNPRFAVAVLIEKPKDNFGGKAAAPVFSRIMGETLRLYDVPYDKPLKATN